MTEEDRMWEEFNIWHKASYGWNMRDDRARNSQVGYDGMVAWYAWLEATERAKGQNAKVSGERSESAALPGSEADHLAGAGKPMGEEA